jgi:hypothetical protein
VASSTKRWPPSQADSQLEWPTPPRRSQAPLPQPDTRVSSSGRRRRDRRERKPTCGPSRHLRSRPATRRRSSTPLAEWVEPSLQHTAGRKTPRLHANHAKAANREKRTTGLEPAHGRGLDRQRGSTGREYSFTSASCDLRNDGGLRRDARLSSIAVVRRSRVAARFGLQAAATVLADRHRSRCRVVVRSGGPRVSPPCGGGP